jgi:hypothetical protein
MAAILKSIAALPGYTVVPRNEPRLRQRILLNLNPDFVHPSLGAVCLVLKKPDLRLKAAAEGIVGAIGEDESEEVETAIEGRFRLN